MARNKEIENFALACYKDIAGETDYTDTAAFEGIIAGAKWADKTIIDKACEWLLKGGYFVNNNETIDDFRKAMEEA